LSRPVRFDQSGKHAAPQLLQHGQPVVAQSSQIMFGSAHADALQVGAQVPGP
jgi:hypothetical protein